MLHAIQYINDRASEFDGDTEVFRTLAMQYFRQQLLDYTERICDEVTDVLSGETVTRGSGDPAKGRAG